MATEQVNDAAVAAEKAGEMSWDAIAGQFANLWHNYVGSLLIEDILLQLTMIAVSVVIGLWVKRNVTRWTYKVQPDPDGEGFFHYLKTIFLAMVRNIVFSVTAGSTLALGAYLMVTFGFPEKTFVFVRLAYSIFYGIAFLSILLSMLRGFVGETIIVGRVKQTIVVIFWVLAFFDYLGFLDVLVTYLNTVQVPLGGGDLTVWKIIVAIFTVLLTLGIANWLANLVHHFVNGLPTISSNIKLVLNRIISIVFIIFAVITALGTVGIDLTVLSVFGGAVGVGLGFGLQKIASNYISGFIILLDRSVKIGDLVTVDGFKGVVTEINTRFTVVRSLAGLETLVPNEFFVSSTVLNHSYTEPAVVENIDIGIAYGSNIERALEIMREEAGRDRPRIDSSRNSWAIVSELAASSVNLRAGFWVKDPSQGTGSLRTQITLDIMRRFKEEGIEIPFSQLDVNLRHIDAGVVPIEIRQSDSSQA